MRSRWFTSERYGRRATVAGSVIAFGVLCVFAGYAIISSAYLMSNHCIGDSGQLPICPASGPEWARPLPGAAALAGLFAGLAGLLIGRPVRAPGLIVGFLLAAAGLVGGRLMSPMIEG